MTITKAEMTAIANDIMSGNNLLKRDLKAEGWFFEFGSMAALGDCHYGKKVLRLSDKYLNARTKAEQINTITHEMAHAIAYTDYSERGHGAIWKRVHRQLGGTAERTSRVSNLEAVDKKYVVFFENDKGELEVIHKMDRLTAKFRGSRITSLYVPSRKEETQGKLRCVSSVTFNAMKANLEESRAEAKTVEVKPVVKPTQKTETKKVEKKVSARGQAARDAIAKIVTTEIYKDSTVTFYKRRPTDSIFFIKIETATDTIEQRLDVFKKKHSL
ncbi:hypothetical protein VPFG_00108 [Vibrio phage nt-1]|uniref:SprT-like domain-containing protein n=1 Tax=Vibrio phage nt-1 TaxID=115992 RepID=R9TIC2_9CAUD|nr:hypothetical protein VPFG_00108 [Vibrio phage nt-1]AGN30110.1 hypothetical protein VPFG_00108 [Vibrio phage nt-1]